MFGDIPSKGLGSDALSFMSTVQVFYLQYIAVYSTMYTSVLSKMMNTEWGWRQMPRGSKMSTPSYGG